MTTPSPAEVVERLEALLGRYAAFNGDESNTTFYVMLSQIATEARAAASLIRELTTRDAQAKALLKLIHDNLGEYIEREGGKVDVTISLAFEASRPASNQEPDNG